MPSTRSCRLFGDPKVGGAQLGVRIRNRRANQLTAIQDCEFWGIAALGQLGRMRTRTVSLGGNGQFTRLTALQSIGDEPWSPALTEDLDLAVTLAIGGWHLTSTPDQLGQPAGSGPGPAADQAADPLVPGPHDHGHRPPG